MAAKRRRERAGISPTFLSPLKPETQRSIYGVISGIATVLFLLAPLGEGGPAGRLVYAEAADSCAGFFLGCGWLSSLFGVGYFLLPISLALLTIGLFRQKGADGWGAARFIGALLLFLSGIGILSIAGGDHTGSLNYWGGFAGYWIASPFISLFAVSLASVIFGGIAIVGALLALDTHLLLPKLSLPSFLKRKAEPEDEMTVSDPYEDEAPVAEAEEKPEKKKEAKKKNLRQR